MQIIREKFYGCYSHWAIAMKYWRYFKKTLGRIITTYTMQFME